MDDYEALGVSPYDPSLNFAKSRPLNFAECSDKEIDKLYSSMTYIKPSRQPKKQSPLKQLSCPACKNLLYTTIPNNPLLFVVNDTKNISYWRNECLVCRCNWYQVQLPVDKCEPVLPRLSESGCYTLYTHENNIEEWPHWIVYPNTMFTKGNLQPKDYYIVTKPPESQETKESKANDKKPYKFCVIS